MDPLERCRQFASVTEASEDEALNWLEMTGFVLQDAVDLYFNSGGAEPAAGSASSGSRKHSYDQGFEDEENVRLPDQVKRQKLVDTDPYLATQVSKRITSAFTSGKSQKNMSDKEKTLSEIFKVPLDIMTQTGFEEAKDLASSEDKWLLVNIQKDSEFQSHALNRDFWSDECVKDMIICSFVFWQQQDVSPMGETFVAYYKVTSFPHVAIIDPRTGACKWQYKFSGNLVPKLLAEKLQDFLGDNPAPSQSRRQLTLPVTVQNNSLGSSSSRSSVRRGSATAASDASAIAGAIAGGEDADAELEEAIRLSLLHQSSNQPVHANTTISNTGSSAGNSSHGSAPTSMFALPNKVTSGGSGSSSAREPEHVPGFCVKQVLQEADTASSSDAGGAGDAEGAATPVVMIRAQFRLPGNMKLTEKFSTSEEVIALVRTVAKQIPAADAEKRFEIHFNFPRQNLSDLLHQHSSAAKSSNSGDNGALKLKDIGVTLDTAFHVVYL